MIFRYCDDTDVISLSDFIEHVRNLGKIESIEDYDNIVPLLKRLANNKYLLVDFLADQLEEDIYQYQINSPYNIQSIMLARCEHFDIRANFWPSENDYDLTRLGGFFAYHLPHDHNFHFATIGCNEYCYETDLFEYDYADYQVGDKVDLVYKGRKTLDNRTVMIYEKNKDIHIQLPPPVMTMSLNLIPSQYLVDYQYTFCTTRSVVKSVVKNSSPVASLQEMLKLLGENNLVEKIRERSY